MFLSLSSMSCFSNLVEPKEGWWEPVIYRLLVKSADDNLGLRLESVFGVGGAAL